MSNEVGPLDLRVDEWPMLSERVVIVFGGVTKSGDRRARREIRTALLNNCDVVWFDAWEGVEHIGLTVRRDVVSEDSDRRVVVIGYRARERSLLVNRLPNASRFVASRVESSAVGRVRAASVVLALFEGVWNRVARPVFAAVAKSARGRAAWGELESDIRHVAELVPRPECIVYSDDYSLPVAWNASQTVWRDCPAGGSFVAQQEMSR